MKGNIREAKTTIINMSLNSWLTMIEVAAAGMLRSLRLRRQKRRKRRGNRKKRRNRPRGRVLGRRNIKLEKKERHTHTRAHENIKHILT